MDIKFLFYAFLCIIAYILLMYFGNKKTVLIKEREFYKKLLKLKLSKRILIIILAWIFSAIWIIIAYKYDYKGLSILGMSPFIIVCFGVINIPVWEYLRKRILKSSYPNYIKTWLNFFNSLLLIFIEAAAIFIIGHSVILARFLNLI